MDSLNLNKHISGQFNAELESIRTQVMTMGGMVEQQLSDAITAMHNQDSELAKRVVEGDHQVNMMEVAIDEACVRIIAKRQPTASDLRLVMAIIKTIAELERIGDVADKICRTSAGKILPTASAAVGESGIAGPPYRTDATRRTGRIRADGS
ncbi:phosphate transport system regulatory protein [Salmonella enterica subsp. arizonae]|nr:phosphate transport system regulatory protein [Salmonella enterica subsp. arizonae]